MPFDTTPRTGFFSSVIFEPGMYVPSGREHADEAGARVGRAADHLEQRSALLDLDLHDLQLVGVGMLAGLDDARDAERAELVGRIVDALDLQADRRQRSRSHRPRLGLRGDP